jgi:hypothetical protein
MAAVSMDREWIDHHPKNSITIQKWRRADNGKVEILLTQGKIAVCDEADWDILKDHKWCTLKTPKCDVFYAVTRHPSNSGTVSMHRMLLPSAKVVDHLTGDGLDNTRANLRSADQSVNNLNRHRQSNNKSSFIGVKHFGPFGKHKTVCWIADLQINGKRRVKRFYYGKPRSKYATSDEAKNAAIAQRQEWNALTGTLSGAVPQSSPSESTAPSKFNGERVEFNVA